MMKRTYAAAERPPVAIAMRERSLALIIRIVIRVERSAIRVRAARLTWYSTITITRL
jgi:hypothetical protein